jgi:hypothetical protein
MHWIPSRLCTERRTAAGIRGTASSGCVSQTDKEKYYLELGRTDDMYIKGSAQAQTFLEGKQWYADDGEGRQRYADAHLKTFLHDWDNQKYLCVVPCKSSSLWHWLRRTLCTTLGQMFKLLGKEHTAYDIYKIYMTRKIVVRMLEDQERRARSRKPLWPDYVACRRLLAPDQQHLFILYT